MVPIVHLHVIPLCIDLYSSFFLIIILYLKGRNEEQKYQNVILDLSFLSNLDNTPRSSRKCNVTISFLGVYDIWYNLDLTLNFWTPIPSVINAATYQSVSIRLVCKV